MRHTTSMLYISDSAFTLYYNMDGSELFSYPTILYLGRESFIDLIIEGGPEILIDNINCTGSEQSLTDCMFSPEVSDCLGNITHRVGVRCHEESKIL